MILVNSNGTGSDSLSFSAVLFNVGVGGCSNGGGCAGLHICGGTSMLIDPSGVNNRE